MVESIRELEHKLIDLKGDGDFRSAAEVSYVLAILYLEKEDEEEAKFFALESIRFFGLCDTDTLEDCTPRYSSLGGVSLPGMIHAGVVRSRLETVLKSTHLEIVPMIPQSESKGDEQ